MSVKSEVTRIKNLISQSYTAISDKGGTLPTSRNRTSNYLASSINSIPSNAAPITVNTESGATVTATKGSRTINLSWNGAAYVGSLDEYGFWTITATKNGNVSYASVDVEEATNYTVSIQFVVTISISGSGNSSHSYVMIDGTKRTSSGTYTVGMGSVLTFGIYGASSSNEGYVKINGIDVISVTNKTDTQYAWAIPSGVQNVNIELSYYQTGLFTKTPQYGRSVVTTS